MQLSVKASSSSSSLQAVRKALSVILAQGYQVSPDALRLLQGLMEKRGTKARSGPEPDVPVETILMLSVEEKVRIGRNEVATSDLKTITSEDLNRAFPDLFIGITNNVERPTPQQPKKTVLQQQQASAAATEVKGPPPTPAATQSSSSPSIQPFQEQEIEIIKDPSEKVRPTGTEGFAQLFKSRYEKLTKIFMERPEGRQLVKISKISEKSGTREGSSQNNFKIAGLVFQKRPTKNGVELTIDDDTGKVSVLALSEEAKKGAAQLSLDQCVMLDVDARSEGKLMLRSVIQPDVPNRLSSTSKKTVYAVFLSDLHIGSNKFLEGAFDRFLLWLQGRWHYEEDEELLSRLKYVIIGGDVVDGVGIFPNQEYELTERNIYKQYEMVSAKLKQMPAHLQMMIIPGNHDSARQALPQPMIPRKYAGELYDYPNVTMLGDPCMIKLHGVSILVYHGRSLDDVLATTPGLSYERPTEAMKVLLRARHLAPMFGSRTPIAPEIEDHLVIDSVPDIFHAGHVHTLGAESYKSTLIINSGTWQAQTGYQANLGIMPRPGVVPIVNLATLDVTFREFLVSTG